MTSIVHSKSSVSISVSETPDSKHSLQASDSMHSPQPIHSKHLPQASDKKHSPRSPVSSLGSSDSSANGETALYTVSFSQDSGCFACGTSKDCRMYDADSCRQTCKNAFGSGGIGIVEMLFSSNVFAFVGSEGNHEYPPNRITIWNDYTKDLLCQVTFRSKIRGVKLRRDLLVVVLEHRMFVYNLQNLKLLYTIETVANPRGLCALSHTSNSCVLACPGLYRGEVRVEHYGLEITRHIPAHDSHIACLMLTLNGHLLATASTKGTLVRIFNTLDGTLLQEVRRGADRAEIYSIALSPTAHWLAVSSDKGTIHVFSLKVQVAQEDSNNLNVNAVVQLPGSRILPVSNNEKLVTHTGANTSSSLSCMKGILPKYFSSEWSFAQFHLPENTRFHVAFGKENTIIIIGLNGSFYRCAFDPVHGGQMEQKEYKKFL